MRSKELEEKIQKLTDKYIKDVDAAVDTQRQRDYDSIMRDYCMRGLLQTGHRLFAASRL